MKIKYSNTGASARAHLRPHSYHATVGLDREFHIVTRNEVLDLPKRCYTESVDGKYYRTNFAIGFEIEKLTITQEREYPIFRGYETDSSLSSSPRANRAGEAITNILPLVPNSNLKNQIMDMMAEAAPMFAKTGAQTFRFARIMTGNNAGDFLLGVTYPSMTEIEATYDALGTSPVASKIYASLDVNLRTIIKVQSTAS